MTIKMFSKAYFKTILIIWIVLLCIISYSFITETILPVFIKRQFFWGITGIIAFMVLTGGVSIFVYGGYLLFMNTLKLFRENEKLMENIFLLRNEDTSKEIKRKIRKENFNFLIQAWKPTFKYFALAVLLIVFGSIILNISDGTINIR
jgi:hypothetical protein